MMFTYVNGGDYNYLLLLNTITFRYSYSTLGLYGGNIACKVTYIVRVLSFFCFDFIGFFQEAQKLWKVGNFRELRCLHTLMGVIIIIYCY